MKTTLKWLRIEANTLKKAEGKGYEKGYKQGQLEIACKMLKRKWSIEEIMENTGLTKEEVKNLYKKA